MVHNVRESEYSKLQGRAEPRQADVSDDRFAGEIAKLKPQAELALLCRILASEGYRDNIAGHITYKQTDGSLLVNPIGLLWDEVRASDIVRIDEAGNIIEGKWEITVAIPLHVEAHKLRPDIVVAVHNHPWWGTVWANAKHVPPIYDQASAFIAEEISIYDEFEGGVQETDNARAAVESVGASGCALLRNHGVFVVAQSVEEAWMRAYALERRCKLAYYVQTLGAGAPMRSDVAKGTHDIVNGDFPLRKQFWHAAVRRQLRASLDVLD